MNNALDPNLAPGPNNTASDMRVQSGFPIWSLIADWIAHHYQDEAVIADYALNLQEWEAAKTFYQKHQAMIDARIILNQEPVGELVDGLNTPEEFFAWSLKQSA
ncbi:MAG: hypothetical protein H0U76_11615 [Ktedonobacteraceae bacterium]|nr:hypothetical protein [Ktedonobacteraceae bacterium]MBA3823751.1 hypothetical protein [Ktedonobacterales bacterium]